MVDFLKNLGFVKALFTLFIGLLSFLAVQVYNKVDSMPDKFVRAERYANDMEVHSEQYQSDTRRTDRTLNEIQKDIKDILKILK